MAVLEWEKLLLYPANTPVKDIPIQPSVTVPEGWGIGTALTPTDGYDPQQPKGGTTHYAATTVEQLEDSPVITGQYFHEFALAPEVTPKHYIDVVSDSAEDSNLRPALLAELSNLVRETGAAYDSRHYNVYHFLLTLSDVAGGEGLEHGQSSDNGVGEKGFSDDAHQLAESDLLSHEFTHSWNGKYRRPFNLYQTDFARMQQGSLLWVYEGMTQYLGNVLAARSGLKSQEQYRDLLAVSAANLDYKPGREWRSTEDTAIAASILRGGNPAWSNWKRGQDYYQEGELFWLDADTLIRKLTDNKKSLTDFLHIFLAKGGNTGPLIVTYNRDELIADLNQVVKYDWATFIHDRIDAINPHADLAGIEQGGYKLVFTDKPTASERTMASTAGRRGGGINVWYSIGLRVMRRRHHLRRPLERPRRQSRNSPPARRSSPSTATSSPPTPSRPPSRKPKAKPSPSTSSSSPTPSSPPPTSTTTTASATPPSSASTAPPPTSTTSPNPSPPPRRSPRRKPARTPPNRL